MGGCLLAVLLVGALLSAPSAADASAGKAPQRADAAKSARSPAPRRFFGIMPEQAYSATGAERARMMAAIAATGVGTLRQVFYWSHIERFPGVYDFAYFDRFVGDAAEHGLSVLGVLFDPPRFASAAPLDVPLGVLTYPPRSDAHFARFAVAAVRRYGPAGSLWSEHPELPYRPVRAWQVWNEPNARAAWPDGPSATAYVRMLQTVGEAIHRADPQVEVVTAGLADSSRGVRLGRFLERMYRRGAEGSFDTLALNAYAPTARGVTGVVAQARAVMRRHGDAKPIRITELGWATGGPGKHRLDVGKRRQARLIRATLPRLARQRRRLGIRSLSYWNWMDLPRAPGQREYWGNHAGLLDSSGRPKPGLRAFTRAIRALRR